MGRNHFVYYVPGRVSLTSKVAAEIGLSSQCPNPLARGCSPGPDGGSGVCVIDKSHDAVPETPGLEWIAAPKGDAEKPPYWIGLKRDAMPTPQDLERSVMQPGKIVTLKSGHSWQVPELRTWHAGDKGSIVYQTRLPAMLDIDDYGRPCRGQVVPEYRKVFDLGLRIVMNRYGGANDLSMTDAYAFLIDVLAINYHVTMVELQSSVLDSIRTDEVFELIDVATDAEGFLDASKKADGRLIQPDTTSDDGSSRPTQDETTPTDPPSAN